MDANLYQEVTERTEIYSKASKEFITSANESGYGSQQLERMERLLSLMYCVGKLNGESGEVAEKVFKLFRDGGANSYALSPDLLVSLFHELGDVCWYLARISDLLGFDLNSIMEGNLEKLADRKQRGVLSGSGDER